MAIFKTDWTGELEQANTALIKFLHEEVEPVVSKTLDRSVHEVEDILGKLSFEMKQTIEHAATEVEQQRLHLVRNLWIMMVASLGLFTLSGAFLIWLFKTL